MALSEQDKERIIEILSKAFGDNLSINYIVKQDAHRETRIRRLMMYALENCTRSGRVILSPGKDACSLVLLPHTKRFSLASLWLDVLLIIQVTGLFSFWKVMERERQIAKQHPKSEFYYLWFIAVDPAVKGEGKGTALLRQLIEESESLNLPFHLETSTVINLPWYRNFGFKIYHELNLGYSLFFLKRIS
ncbi:GNAT family N-acetyltransferase [Pedobacter sp. GR22-6]|uniref:GNAT family N-acetyltransferase n=1 Tax=Pedobacter sp. GR22-6 TaxID=3127957 RepID=UPI00307D9CAA